MFATRFGIDNLIVPCQYVLHAYMAWTAFANYYNDASKKLKLLLLRPTLQLSAGSMQVGTSASLHSMSTVRQDTHDMQDTALCMFSIIAPGVEAGLTTTALHYRIRCKRTPIQHESIIMSHLGIVASHRNTTTVLEL